jgi:hypothetical protein
MSLKARIDRLEGSTKKAPKIIFYDVDQGPPPASEGDVMLVRWMSRDEPCYDPALRGTEGMK